MLKERYHDLTHLGFTIHSGVGVGEAPLHAMVQKELCNFFSLIRKAARADFYFFLYEKLTFPGSGLGRPWAPTQYLKAVVASQ